ncbi:glutamate receptor, ionotropic kainate 2 [Elysia marginata]|uniref:Glutamate receptor, ionotropic kainate 2 n=1 Tax=Elysia marginata TaxID=1093978 RepID=A0AAV4JM75_9GAST|nr:glutamate receptor, ionotropic kainate 2 [Elysia marginata]
MTTEFDTFLSCPGTPTKLIVWSLGSFCDPLEVQKILMMSLDMETDIKSVVVAGSNTHFIQMVMEIVTTNTKFKWRRFLHATEWLILTVDRLSQVSSLLNYKGLPDFMTVCSLQEAYIDILQKSRTHSMKRVLQIPLTRKFLWSSNVSSNVLHSRNQLFLSHRLRRDAVTYLSWQKSVMVGMRIPTVVIVSKPDQVFYENETDHTSWVGFNIDILNLLCKTLGFTAEPFPVTDGGFYSVFKPDGKILGLTGYLVRREAGFSPMGMISSSHRRNVTDFVYPNIKNDPFYIIYRVNFRQSQLGDPLSELIDTGQDVTFVLIGPLIAIAVGLVALLVNGIFLSNYKICGPENLRRLYDFPLQWLFQTTEHFPNQSTRILRASYGLFCVAMFASYGALLTSNATAPEEYPTINSVEDLLSHPNFKIGNPLSNSHFITVMERAAPGTSLANLWLVLCKQNRSDPGTFSEDKAYHIRRVLQGEYAFLSDISLGLLSTYVDADYGDVRFVKLFDRVTQMAVPKNVFYKHDIERVVLAAAETGLLKSLFDKWFPPKAFLRKSKVENDPKVYFSQIKLLVYIAAAGIGCACLGLGVEYLIRLKVVIKREDG